MQLVSQQTLASSAPALTKAAEFESLVHRYQNSVYSIALRMTGNPHEAQDLTQEAFVRAYRAFDSTARNPFDKYVRIVTNLYIDEEVEAHASSSRSTSPWAPTMVIRARAA